MLLNLSGIFLLKTGLYVYIYIINYKINCCNFNMNVLEFTMYKQKCLIFC